MIYGSNETPENSSATYEPHAISKWQEKFISTHYGREKFVQAACNSNTDKVGFHNFVAIYDLQTAEERFYKAQLT